MLSVVLIGHGEVRVLTESSIFNYTNHEVYVVSTLAFNKRWGFVATWVLPLTLMGSHRQFLVAVSSQNTSWDALRSTKKLALQMLSTEHAHLVPLFGTTASCDTNKFADQPMDHRSQMPVLAGCVGFVEAEIIAIHNSPDQQRKLVIAKTIHSFGPLNSPPQNPPTPLTTKALKTLLSQKDLDRLAAHRLKLFTDSPPQ